MIIILFTYFLDIVESRPDWTSVLSGGGCNT